MADLAQFGKTLGGIKIAPFLNYTFSDLYNYSTPGQIAQIKSDYFSGRIKKDEANRRLSQLTMEMGRGAGLAISAPQAVSSGTLLKALNKATQAGDIKTAETLTRMVRERAMGPKIPGELEGLAEKARALPRAQWLGEFKATLGGSEYAAPTKEIAYYAQRMQELGLRPEDFYDLVTGSIPNIPKPLKWPSGPTRMIEPGKLPSFYEAPPLPRTAAIPPTAPYQPGRLETFLSKFARKKPLILKGEASYTPPPHGPGPTLRRMRGR